MRRPTDADKKWVERLRSDDSLKCFSTIIKYGVQMQSAAEFSEFPRTYRNKYGDFVAMCKALADEIYRGYGRGMLLRC